MQFRVILGILFCSLQFTLLSQEICDNAIDDDGDGFIDLNDDECVCNFDDEVQVPDYSLFPNPSFEETGCCPRGVTQMFCAKNWKQASNATTDYFNACGYMPGIIPRPIPDGEGCVGCIWSKSWHESMGACLLDTLYKDRDYVVNFYIVSGTQSANQGYARPNDRGAIDVMIYGTANCDNIPFDGETCPLNNGKDWEIIGSYTYDPVWEWQNISIRLRATKNITAVVIGPPCTLPPSYINETETAYFGFDKLTMSNAEAFSFQDRYYSSDLDLWVDGVHDGSGNDYIANPKNAYCADQISLEVKTLTDAKFQWYYEGIALVGDSSASLLLDAKDFGDGLYTFTMTTAYGCSAKNFSIAKPGFPAADFSLSDLCYPQEIMLKDISKKTSPIIDWQWKESDMLFSTDKNPRLVIDNARLPIQLKVTQKNFCADSVKRDISFLPKPKADFLYLNNCLNDSLFLIDQSTVSDNAQITQWRWDFGDGSPRDTRKNTSYKYDKTGNYAVQLLVATNGNCLDSVNIEIPIRPNPNADFEPKILESNFDDAYLQFVNNSTTGTSVLWTLTDSIESEEWSPYQIYPMPYYGPVTLQIEDEFGCLDISEQWLNLSNMESIYVPNSFSPNNDHINDIFLPVLNSAQIERYHLCIINRWGESIFESYQPEEGWNGQINGENLASSLFIWQLNVKFLNEEEERNISGSLYLLR